MFEMLCMLLLCFCNVNVNVFVSGVGECYFQVCGMCFVFGVVFDDDVVCCQVQVVVIDQNMCCKLFGVMCNLVGEVILVDNVLCVVIGVIVDKKSVFGSVKSLNVWVLYMIVSGCLFGQCYFDSIIVWVCDGQLSVVVEKSFEKLMIQCYGCKDFFMYNMDSVVKIVEKIGQLLMLLLLLIVVILFVVGGIGVMNIMLVLVIECMCEIGIWMVVGVCQFDILQQFFVEVVFVCLFGGMIGIVLLFGFGVLFLMFVVQWKMVFLVGVIVIVFVCLMFIGVIFGFMFVCNVLWFDLIDVFVCD